MTVLRCVVLVLSLNLLAGCSSQPAKGLPPVFSELQEVNDLLHAAAGPSVRAPAKLADVGRYRSMFPRGYEAINSGNVVVLWGAALKGEGDVGKDEAVVAYEKDVPTSGGYVLLSAGTVKKMTASEFASAPKGAS
jgi:hypothetical protein